MERDPPREGFTQPALIKLCLNPNYRDSFELIKSNWCATEINKSFVYLGENVKWHRIDRSNPKFHPRSSHLYRLFTFNILFVHILVDKIYIYFFTIRRRRRSCPNFTEKSGYIINARHLFWLEGRNEQFNSFFQIESAN